MYRVLGPADKEEWVGMLALFKELDVHYYPEYCRLFAAEEKGEARMFVFQKEAGTVIYPFIMRRIDEYCDITTPYGYGGPVVAGPDGENLAGDFRACFERYCLEQGIVTEFIRFHPLLENHRLMAPYLPVGRFSTVVYVDLTRPEEEIRAGYGYNNRKNINKAVRAGLEVVIEEAPDHFAEFKHIYNHTLQRNRAGRHYYFTDEFFEKIHRLLAGRFLYACTVYKGSVIAAELLLFNHHYIHSFLGGTLAEYFELRPANLLKHRVAGWAKAKGIKRFILGGGREEEDGIFRFKKSFSRDGLAGYYLGKKIHLPDVEQRLAELYPAGRADYFPRYRG
ncbi:MAG: GNAT family N-acetyltransferase [Peptococcaceae bacterium]|nr:MAG: GNAT family N-acetyltransferase [Peptococcaceae bacterium]